MSAFRVVVAGAIGAMVVAAFVVAGQNRRRALRTAAISGICQRTNRSIGRGSEFTFAASYLGRWITCRWRPTARATRCSRLPGPKASNSSARALKSRTAWRDSIGTCPPTPAAAGIRPP